MEDVTRIKELMNLHTKLDT